MSDSWLLNEVGVGRWELVGTDFSGPDPIIDVDEFYSTPQEALDAHGLDLVTDAVDLEWIIGEKSYLDAETVAHPSISPNPLIPISFSEALQPQPTNVHFPVISQSEATRIIEGDFAGIRLEVSLTATVDFTVTTFNSEVTELSEGGTGAVCNGGVTHVFIPGDTGAGSQTFSKEFPQSGVPNCGVRNCDNAVPFDEAYLASLTHVHPEAGITASDPILVEADSQSSVENCPGGGPTFTYYAPVTEPLNSYFTGMDAGFFFYRSTSDNLIHFAFSAIFEFGPLFIAVYAPVTGSVDFKTVYGYPDAPTSGADGGLVAEGGGECAENALTASETSGGMSLFGVGLNTYSWTYDVEHGTDTMAADPLSCCANVGCQDVGTETFVLAITDLSEL